MPVDEWDSETGLRVVRPKRIEFSVGPGSTAPPWHPEHGGEDDPGDASGEREPKRQGPSGGGSASAAEAKPDKHVL